MSLINEMLRDLEARRAAELGKMDLQREIRPLPGRQLPPSRSMPLLLGGGLLAAMTAGAALWAWQADVWHGRMLLPDNVATPKASAAVARPVLPAPQELLPVAVPEPLRLAETLSSPPAALSSSAAVKSPGLEAITAEKKQRQAKVVSPQLSAGGVLPPPPPVPETPLKASAAVANGSAGTQGNIEKITTLATPRERADAEYRRAQGLLAAGGATAATVEALQNALRQDSTYGPARQLLLRLLLESRRIDEAMSLLQEGLEQQPTQAGWAMSLARLQVERGDVAAGERTLARFGSNGASSAEYLGFHGYLLSRLGHFREAGEQYQSAARMAPSDGRWWFGLGQAMEARGQADEARSAFRRALEAGSLNAEMMALADQKAR